MDEKKKSVHLPDGGTPSSSKSSDHGVGYCRPPLHSRFKSGVSGNPKGRRRGIKNLKTMIQQALTSSITIREGENRRTITTAEAVVLRQIEAALKGSQGAALAVLKIAAQAGLLEEAVGISGEEQPLSTADREMLKEILTKAGISTPDSSDEDPS